MCLCVCVLTDNGSWNVVCMYIDGRTGYVSVCLCVYSATGRKSMIGRTGYVSVCLCV